MERVVLITPARDEAAHLERTIRAVAVQTRTPDLWLIVDDGSTDATPGILRHWEGELPFLRVLQAPQSDGGDGKDRLAFAAEAAATNFALGTVNVETFTHVGKLDADVELPPEYFQRLLDRFDVEAELGVAGGQLLEDHGAGWRLAAVPAHHVRGALKLYSAECFAAIGGIEERLGWDTIDEVRARMHGYTTRSIAGIDARHHRPVASRGGTLRGRARHGQAAYILRYGAWWVGLKSLKEAFSPPYLLSGGAYFWGYLRAVIRREERVEDPAFARFVAAELRRRALPGAVAKAISGDRRNAAKVPANLGRS